MSQMRAIKAHRSGSPIPMPTPSAILPVVVNPVAEAGLAEGDETVCEAEGEFEDTGVARLSVFIEVAVAVAAVAAVVVVVVGSVMLKYVETKPSGPSGFTQKKNSFEYERSKPSSWTVQVKFVT